MNSRWIGLRAAIFACLAFATRPASADLLVVNATADVNQGQELITATMALDRAVPDSTGSGNLNNAVACGIPWPKAIIWLLKTAAPGYIFDASGGSLAGSFEMGQGAELITATFDLITSGPGTADATLQINGAIVPNDFTGVWESLETVTSTGPGQVSANGTTIFQSLSGPVTMPYVVTYDFLGDPSAVYAGPATVFQSVDYDLPSGQFTTTVKLIPEPASWLLLAIGLLTAAAARARPSKSGCSQRGRT